jgi:hypothetical protein
MFAFLVVASLLVVVVNTVGPGRLSDVSVLAILLIGPLGALAAGVIAGLRQRLPSPLEVFVVAYISAVAAGLCWLSANDQTHQAMTNSVVATAALLLIEPAVSVATGLSGSHVARRWSGTPLRDAPGRRDAR